jgi:hypothetical protein
MIALRNDGRRYPSEARFHESLSMTGGLVSEKRPALAPTSPDYYNPAAGYFDSWNRFRWKRYAR